jgi:hypothetical protein
VDRYVETLASAQANGAALSNTTTAASLLPTAAMPRLPGGFLSRIGQELSLFASGRCSNQGGGAGGTLTFTVQKGATNIAVSPGFTLTNNTNVNATWRLRWDLTLRAVGSAANVMHTGYFLNDTTIGAPVPGVAPAVQLLIPLSAPAVGANFDSTTEEEIDLVGQWSVASAQNSIQLHQFRLVSWN